MFSKLSIQESKAIPCVFCEYKKNIIRLGDDTFLDLLVVLALYCKQKTHCRTFSKQRFYEIEVRETVFQ